MDCWAAVELTLTHCEDSAKHPVGEGCGRSTRVRIGSSRSRASRADMSFSRSNRNDRRRRVIRESIATDSDFAVESARAQKRARRASLEERSETLQTGYRDPGYSQAVRKTCQQRMVQLIPIRPGSLALILSVMWMMWGLLLLAHYFFHVRGNETGRSGLLILQLFDVRSPHSIANWMTCQLWMLTAIVAWMIYRIRQHKLDDYRARYRIWIVLACIALFSSFDTATSALYLLGQSIDGWTRKEIGYGGWPLVLASYASLVALMGLRLSSELKGTPTAIAFWFGGLLAWACAALLGTGLLKLNWSPGTIDLTVGACWLGGVLLVFQAAGMYLRHCYIQAQKRFVERAIAAPTNFRVGVPSMPRMPWSRAKSMGNSKAKDDEEDEEKDRAGEDDDVLGTIPKKTWLSWRKKSSEVEDSDAKEGAKSATSKSVTPPKEPKRPMRLFGMLPSRMEANELLVDEPIAEDAGGPIDSGLSKKAGWFGIGGNKSKEPQARSASTPKPAAKSEPRREDPKPATNPTKRGWIPAFGRSKSAVEAPSAKTATPTKTESKPTEPREARKSWLPFRKRSDATGAPVKAAESKPTATKPSDPPKEKPKTVKPADSSDNKATKRIASKIFGWLDGLKLKPPVDDAPSARSTSSTATSNETGPKPIASSGTPFPSTSANPTSTTSQYPSDDDDDGSTDYRNLSKAERKRLRRQQGNDRYAA
jgi:hypothetical protein